MTHTNFLTVSICLLFSCQLQAAPNIDAYNELNSYRASGGPDAYGYTWSDSNEPNGPIFNWIDITSVGTQVTDLADDNSSQMIPMGMNFQYYWVTYSNLKIGSNGWLSFNNIGNVAHCFPRFPTPAGSGDNLIAPFMTDLNFTGAGNPGEVYYYYDSAEELFIVSYINVPWWFQNVPGYIGSNTFQVIFSAVDKSITYQYLDMDPDNFNDSELCDADLEVGFENNTGDIGLEIFNEQVPADNYAIKITFPDIPLIDIIDVEPTWNQNSENKAVFVPADTDYALMTHVKNSGNLDTIDDVSVNLELFKHNGAPVFTLYNTLPGLMALEETDVMYSTPLNVVEGHYGLKVTTETADDANPSNDINITELNVINTSSSPIQLSYTTDDFATGLISWSAGQGGGASYFKPPTDFWQITSVDMYIVSYDGSGLDFTVGLYDNDNGDGLPGTLLSSVLVTGGSYTLNSWVTIELPTPVIAPSNGFYVTWEQNGAEGIGLGTTNTTPVSRHSFEKLGGQWSEYRSNENEDFMIRVNMVDLIFSNGFE